MKKVFLLVLISVWSISAFSKKVKFMVDMDTITINFNGIHITGDFQDEAGFAADWDPGTTAMTQEVSDPGIYSIVVDIPAFRHYEFKFVNGIFGYEVEFVPSQSRVGYQFNDNRWIYIDSLANDTQVVAPVIYSQNAPAKKHLLRFKVDMQNAGTVSSLGVHVAGNFQGFNPAATRMHSFDGKVHEYIAYVDTGIPAFQHEYKFYNGNTSGVSEAVPLACANVNGNRGVYVTSDSVLWAVCFAGCSPCVLSGIFEDNENSFILVYPNPSKGEFNVQCSMLPDAEMRVYDILGNLIVERALNDKPGTLNIALPGIYFMKIESRGQIFSEKIVVE